jgi:hypothetical protein
MNTLDFINLRNKRVILNGNELEIGSLRLNLSDELNFGEPIGNVAVKDLAEAADYYNSLTSKTCWTQLAALTFVVTGKYQALDWYFPITNMLNEAELSDFYRFIQEIIQDPNLDLKLKAENKTDATAQMRSDIPFIVGGHLAEIFFYRRDILARLLHTPRHIWLYTSPRAFEQEGGLAGGDYNHETESIQLTLSRLYEGFYGSTPGVAPFLHEFGHMLDFFNAGTGRMGDSEGLLPGLSPADGKIYTPRARKLFIEGKRIELERYLKRFNNTYSENDPLPIGHPYVFQNDTEFCAGYFEMFFRNPNYFASQNPALYQGYVELLGQDQRHAWKNDFDFYVKENRSFYLNSGQKPWESHLTIPTI